MTEPALLFVYGSLMPAAASALGHGQRTRLAGQSDLLGPATVAGRLYDLGNYPGLVLDPGAGDVHGELLRLKEPARTWRWLDAYEGIVPGAPDASEYRREIHPVRRADGTIVNAWIYVFNLAPAGHPLIPTGRWTGQ